MASTTSYEINDATWTKVAEGSANVAVQLANQGRILIHIGDSAPGPDAAGIAIGNTTRELPKTFAVSNLPMTAGVYAIALVENPMNVVVLAY